MENWEIDFYWLRVRHFIRDGFQTNSLPDLEAILFLIGVQELGLVQTHFTKEEKIQLIHIGTARLLSSEGYFRQTGKDGNGWPVWEPVKTMDFDEKTREELLKRRIIDYFGDSLEEE
jgi:hypothetical protein